MAAVRPSLRAISLTSAARFRWSSALPCEKVSRTTSTPARTMLCSTAGSEDAGPRVATILVLRSIFQSVSPSYATKGTRRHNRQRQRGAARGLPLRRLVHGLRRIPRHLRQARAGAAWRALRVAGRRRRQRADRRHREREFY